MVILCGKLIFIFILGGDIGKKEIFKPELVLIIKGVRNIAMRLTWHLDMGKVLLSLNPTVASMFPPVLPLCNLIGLKLYKFSYSCIVYYIPDTVLSTLHILFHFVAIATEWNGYCYYFHFIIKKTGALRN